MAREAGKGDKWRKTDFKKYAANYEEIEWREKNQYCCGCGISLRNSNTKTVYSDGTVACYPNCNFN